MVTTANVKEVNDDDLSLSLLQLKQIGAVEATAAI